MSLIFKYVVFNSTKLPNFQQRRLVSKLRCSDHALEIEKGRHKKGGTGTPPNERICTLCKNGQIEDEEHFLLICRIYNPLRRTYKIDNITEISSFFSDENLDTLGKYLSEAFELRDLHKRDGTEAGVGQPGQVDRDH